jgi:hypothetical protein
VHIECGEKRSTGVAHVVDADAADACPGTPGVEAAVEVARLDRDVVRGRWGKSAVSAGLAQSLEVDDVPVLARCVPLGLPIHSHGLLSASAFL